MLKSRLGTQARNKRIAPKRAKDFDVESMKNISDEYLLKNLRLKASRKSLTDCNGRVEVLEVLIIQLYTLYQISKSLCIATQLDEIFSESMKLIDNYLNIHEYCLFLRDESSDKLVIKASHGFHGQDMADVEFALGEGITGTAAQRRETILVRDVSLDSRYLNYKNNVKNSGSLLCIPLIVNARGNELIGVLNVHKSEVDGFTQEDITVFTEIASDLANAIEKARTYEETRELSMRDPLTSLYNRRFFNDHLETEFIRARRYDRTFSLLMIDIDNFKLYNDTNGHLKGDEALVRTAAVLADTLRKCDVIARYGGEEFTVLLPEIDHEGALKAAEHLRRAVEAAAYFNEEALPLGKFTVSIGVATYPGKAESIIDLIDFADKALYAGKSRGRNIVCD